MKLILESWRRYLDEADLEDKSKVSPESVVRNFISVFRDYLSKNYAPGRPEGEKMRVALKEPPMSLEEYKKIFYEGILLRRANVIISKGYIFPTSTEEFRRLRGPLAKKGAVAGYYSLLMGDENYEGGAFLINIEKNVGPLPDIEVYKHEIEHFIDHSKGIYFKRPGRRSQRGLSGPQESEFGKDNELLSLVFLEEPKGFLFG